MRLLLLLALATTSAACAARPSETPATPATIAASAGADGERAGTEATASTGLASNDAAAGGAAEDRPAGNLVCRVINDAGSKAELFLQWEGNEAHGVLREIAPSGMVHEKKVRAERHRGMVIADDIFEKDLVVHAAVVAERGGKKVMKVDDAWSTCQ